MHKFVFRWYSYRIAHILNAVVGVLGLAAMMGCMGESPTKPAYDDAADVYSALQLNYNAITLSTHSPYDTVQLKAVPVNLFGETLQYSEDSIEFRLLSVLDTSIRISPKGKIITNTATGGTRVEASLTINGIKRTAVALVMVRDELPVRRVERIEFAPLPPDSSWRWAVSGATIGHEKWLRAYDFNGQLIPTSNYTASFSFSDPRLNSQQYPNSGIPVGEGYIYTKFYAYDTSFRDSSIIKRIEPPYRFVVAIDVYPAEGGSRLIVQPDSINIKLGTTAYFINKSGYSNSMCQTYQWCKDRSYNVKEYGDMRLVWFDSLDIVFDTPVMADAGQNLSAFGSGRFFTLLATAGMIGALTSDGSIGNIESFGGVNCDGDRLGKCGDFSQGIVDRGYRARQFNTPGKVRFHSTKHPGIKGVIVVTE